MSQVLSRAALLAASSLFAVGALAKDVAAGRRSPGR